MSSGNRSEKEEKKAEARKVLYNEPELEKLSDEFDLSRDAKSAAILIYRILVGLGKGLSSSQESSFSAMAVWIAAENIDGRAPLKRDLANAVGVSLRTLSRRFKEVTEGEEGRKVLDYVESQIKMWSRKKEQRLREIL